MSKKYDEVEIDYNKFAKGSNEHYSMLAAIDRRRCSERSIEEILAQTKSYWMIPRLTDDRLAQLRRLLRRYEREQTNFWLQTPLMLIRDEIGIFAKQSGLSMHEIIVQMNPSDQRADLHRRFNDAINASPVAIKIKIEMNRLLRNWLAQYCHAQKECVHPQCNRVQHAESQREYFEKVVDQMEALARNMPAFGHGPSHFNEVRCCVIETISRVETNLILVTSFPKK